MIWRALAPGKVNLCLFLGETRADGRHELVTLFESVSLADELTLRVREGGADEVVCRGVEGPNLAAAALAGLRARGWAGPPVAIEIVKWVPVAAGMGGGSADAAAAIRLADAVAAVDPVLAGALAAELGADVPSQLSPGVSVGTGAGEIVERVAPLADHAFVIVPLPAELSTPAVYREADRLGLPRGGEELRERLGALRAALGSGGQLAPDSDRQRPRAGGAVAVPGHRARAGRRARGRRRPRARVRIGTDRGRPVSGRRRARAGGSS